jgi:hypothetical protein
MYAPSEGPEGRRGRCIRSFMMHVDKRRRLGWKWRVGVSAQTVVVVVVVRLGDWSGDLAEKSGGRVRALRC